HVFDGEAVGNAGDKVGVEFGDDVADHRQVEGLGHAGDLEPRGDPAGAHQVDHHVIDRARVDHVAERDDAVQQFATADRGRQGGIDPGDPGIVVVRRDVLEPEEADPGFLDPPADVD